MMTIEIRKIIGRPGTASPLAAMLFVLTPAFGLAQAAEQDEFSRANTLLFFSEHLEDIDEPTVLRYAFEKRGTLEEPFTDTISITVSKGDQDGNAVDFSYFTGPRRAYIPPLSSVTGNPVIGVFLQRDVNDMQHRTGGAARYFQNAIKTALEEAAEVKPVKLDYDGQVVAGTEIKVSPYLNDPHREEMAQHANKYYVFTLSDAVPGEVYELRTVVPGQSSALLEETLTLRSAKPLNEEVVN